MTSCISMIFLDQTILPVSLPMIHRQLGLSELELQWIVNSYLLALTSLVLACGRIGDIAGHRKMFCIGMSIFAISSFFCSVSFNAFSFIGSRFLQGIGAAILLPATGSILLDTFPKKEHGKAMGIYVSIGSIFLSLGPFIGGLLTQYLTWRYAFWLNLPIGATGLFLTLAFVPPSKTHKEPFDLLGAITLMIGCLSLIIAVMQSKNWGFSSPLALGLFGTSLLFFVLLVQIEKKASHPLIQFHFFKNKIFSGSIFCIFCMQFILMVTVFWAIYFQNILGFSPAAAGTLSLISNSPVLLFAPLGGYLLDRFGARIPVVTGFLLILFSLVWFLYFSTTSNLWLLLPTLLAFGAGIRLIITPSFVTLIGTVSENQRGMAYGINMTLRQFGGTLGLAIMGALFLTVQGSIFSSGMQQNPLTAKISAHVFEGLLSKTPSAIKKMQELPMNVREIVESIYTEAYIDGFSSINLLAVFMGILGLFCALFTLSKHRE